MTRLWTDGFEAGDLAGYTWSFSHTASNTDAHARGGSRSANLSVGFMRCTLPSPVTEGYARVGVFPHAPDSATAGIFLLLDSTTGHINGDGSPNLEIGRVYATGLLVLRDYSGTVIATGNTAVPVDAWSLVEVYWKIADSGGRCQVRINGQVDIDYTGDTHTATNADVKHVALGGASWTLKGYYDDFAINDTAGGADDSWCGSGTVVYLPASADTATADWTPSTGSDHSALVDEVPTNGDTDYVSTAVDAQVDEYDVAAPSTALDGKLVTRVWAEARARKVDAGSTTKVVMGVDSGTVSDGDPVTLTTTYGRVVGDDLTANPDDTFAWEYADLADVKVRVKSSVV